jgi:drug/metabolite transporter (DMT)-like permease
LAKWHRELIDLGGLAVVILWVMVSIIIGVAANSRGRNGVGWFFVSLLLSPIIALLLLLVFLPIRKQQSLEFNDSELRKNIQRGRHESRF